MPPQKGNNIINPTDRSGKTLKRGTEPVLVHLGCPNKIPQSGVLKQHAFISLQFWKLEGGIRVPAWWDAGESSLCGLQRDTFWLCAHMASPQLFSLILFF